MKNILAFWAILLLSCSFQSICFAQEAKIDSSKMVILRIDPSTAVGAPVSQFFDQIEFIPLETTKESLFGSIAKLEILNDRYIIFDRDTKSVLIFNSDGKYLNKINAKKIPVASGAKTPELNGFNLKEVDGKTYISIYGGDGERYYDTEGTFVKKQEKDHKDIFDKFEVGENGEYFRFYYSKTEKDTVHYDTGLFDKNHNPLKLYFQFTDRRYQGDQFFGSGNSNNYNANTKELFYNRYYCSDIYKGEASGLQLAYKIIFPYANTLPADFISNPIYKNKRFEYFQNHNKQVYGVGNVFKINKDLLAFKLAVWNSDMKTILSYNLKTGELISLNDLEPDANTSFLPIGDGGIGYDFKNKGFVLNKGGYLYTSYSSMAMFKFKELSESKKPVYNAVLTDYFKTQSPASNPILIKLKPKQN